MKHGLILLSVASLAFAGVASASVQQGNTEVSLSGNWSSINGNGDTSDIDLFSISAGLGYFLTDNIQIEVVGMGMWLDSEFEVAGDAFTDNEDFNAESETTLGDLTLWAAGGKIKYHFMPTNQWVPYAGVVLLWGNIEGDGKVTLIDPESPDSPLVSKFDYEGDGLIWGPLVGLRYELNSSNDFCIEYEYKMFENDLGDLFDDAHQVWLGIVHQFN
ncbi:MAG: outer membrane beta-barrel protein [Phycisphaerales bacterium]